MKHNWVIISEIQAVGRIHNKVLETCYIGEMLSDVMNEVVHELLLHGLYWWGEYTWKCFKNDDGNTFHLMYSNERVMISSTFKVYSYTSDDTLSFGHRVNQNYSDYILQEIQTAFERYFNSIDVD